MDNSIQKRVGQLRDELNHHNQLYYIHAKPEISDQAYDKLMAELIELEKKYPELLTPDSPSQRVGGEPIDGFAKVRHAVRMMSIDNAYDAAEVRAFDKSVREKLDNTPRYVIEPKVDGVSCSLRYENGLLTVAATRGNGEEGDDVTVNVRTIRSIPLKLKIPHKSGLFDSSALPNILEVRGEIFMENGDFLEINRQQLEKKEETFANPRNFTAGTLKQLDPKIVASRKLKFIVHGLGQIDPAPPDSYFDFLQTLAGYGLPISLFAKRVESIDEVMQEIELFEKKRATLPYATDGMVVKVDSLRQREELGVTSKSPRWVFAYKYPAEQVQTILRDVVWQVGKLGTITPVAALDPVFVAGTTVQNASLHNPDQILRLDLHVGDTVIVEKAGEIIPQVVGVILEKRPRGAKVVQPPTICPSCASVLSREAVKHGMVAWWCKSSTCTEYLKRKQAKKLPETCRGTSRSKTGCDSRIEQVQHMVDLLCMNPACPAQLGAKVKHFASRDHMDIEGLGEVWADRFVNLGLIGSLTDIYRLKDKSAELSNIEGLGEKSIQTLLTGIEQSKSRPLAKLIGALSIGDVGTSLSRSLVKKYRNLTELASATEADLQTIDDVGPTMAQSVVNYFRSDVGKRIVAELIELGINPQEEIKANNAESQLLSGQSIVVTGTLEHFERKEIEDLIASLGGKPSGSISKKTAFLVAGENAGSKLDKAKELNIPILTEAQFMEKIGKKG